MEPTRPRVAYTWLITWPSDWQGGQTYSKVSWAAGRHFPTHPGVWNRRAEPCVYLSRRKNGKSSEQSSCLWTEPTADISTQGTQCQHYLWQTSQPRVNKYICHSLRRNAFTWRPTELCFWDVFFSMFFTTYMFIDLIQIHLKKQTPFIE